MNRHRIAVGTGASVLFIYDTTDPDTARDRAKAYLERRIAELQQQLDRMDTWVTVCWPPSACPHRNGPCPQASTQLAQSAPAGARTEESPL